MRWIPVYITGPQRLMDWLRASRLSMKWGAATSPAARRPHSPTVASPDTRRSLPVAPLIADKRCYGDSPARLPGRPGAGWEGVPWPSGSAVLTSEVPQQERERFDPRLEILHPDTLILAVGADVVPVNRDTADA